MGIGALGMPPIALFIYSSLGIALAAASAAAINHYIDREADALMDRNKNRPLPKGDLSAAQVLTFALVLGAISMALLIVMVATVDARASTRGGIRCGQWVRATCRLVCIAMRRVPRESRSR